MPNTLNKKPGQSERERISRAQRSSPRPLLPPVKPPRDCSATLLPLLASVKNFVRVVAESASSQKDTTSTKHVPARHPSPPSLLFAPEHQRGQTLVFVLIQASSSSVSTHLRGERREAV